MKRQLTIVAVSFPAAGCLLCIERGPNLAAHLRIRFDDPRLKVLAEDAADLEIHLGSLGLHGRVSLIVSGLPFATLPGELRHEILSVVVRSLTPDGVFLLYQYSYAVRGKLRKHFSSVEGKWEVRSIPPAVVMRCKV